MATLFSAAGSLCASDYPTDRCDDVSTQSADVELVMPNRPEYDLAASRDAFGKLILRPRAPCWTLSMLVRLVIGLPGHTSVSEPISESWSPHNSSIEMDVKWWWWGRRAGKRCRRWRSGGFIHPIVIAGGVVLG